MFETIQADMSHIDDIVKLMQTHKSIMGTEIDIDYIEKFISLMSSFYLTSPDTHRMLAAYQNGELYAILGMRFWGHMPYWSVTNMKTNRDLCGTRFNVHTNGLGACMNKAVLIGEKLSLYRYYALSALRHHKPSMNTWSELLNIYERYDYVIEDMIPANTKPEYEYQWILMGRKQWDVDLIIRSATLRQEFRSFKCSI